MNILKAIGRFFVKVGKAIGRFFVNFGKGFVRFFKNLFISMKNWFVKFGRRFKDSSVPTKVGHFAIGVGNIAHKQYAKGILFLLLEVVFFVFMFSSPTVNDTPLGVKAIGNFFTLGDAHAMNTTNGTNSFSQDYEFKGGQYSAIIVKDGQLDSSSEPVVASIVRTRQVFDKVNSGSLSPEILSQVDKAGKRKADDIWWSYLDVVGEEGLILIDKDYDAELPDIYCYQELNTDDAGLYFRTTTSENNFLWVRSKSELSLSKASFIIEENERDEDDGHLISSEDVTENVEIGVIHAKDGEYHVYCVLIGNNGYEYEVKLTAEAAASLKAAGVERLLTFGYSNDLINENIDFSFLMLLFGILTFAIIVLFILVYMAAVKSQYKADIDVREGRKPTSFIEDLKTLLAERFYLTLLAPAILFLIVFTVIPTILMIIISFTDLETEQGLAGTALMNWTGLENFVALFSNNASTMAREVGQNFGSVLLWTFIWAIIATFSCYFGGILLALLLNKKEIKGKKIWRTIFILTIAIPQFISLLVMRLMLKEGGPINALLGGAKIDWLEQGDTYTGVATPAAVVWRVRAVILVVNLWLGIPYTMLMTSGILMNIPADLYEAATIDGANKFQMFRKITLPYVIFVTTPYLISSFIGNITSFNTIFLLSGGGPSKGAGIIAGETDLLVTWLYKLTITKSLYNAGSVIGILTFIITASMTLIFYRNSKAYKEEDTFQ